MAERFTGSADVRRSRRHDTFSRFKAAHDGLSELEVFLIFQEGRWRYLAGPQSYGSFAFQVDAVEALPRILAKLRRQGWRGAVRLSIQQPWGEVVSVERATSPVKSLDSRAAPRLTPPRAAARRSP